MSGYDLDIPREKRLNYLHLRTVAVDTRPAASDLGMHSLPVTF